MMMFKKSYFQTFRFLQVLGTFISVIPMYYNIYYIK